MRAFSRPQERSLAGKLEPVSPPSPPHAEPELELVPPRLSKEELIQSMDRVDREITMVEQQISKLKKKQVGRRLVPRPRPRRRRPSPRLRGGLSPVRVLTVCVLHVRGRGCCPVRCRRASRGDGTPVPSSYCARLGTELAA